MRKIILIDGNSLMFRAYYATAYRPGNLMQSKSGVYTNAIFAFVNMIDSLIKTDYDNIFVAFDTSEKTFRHREYTEYKAGRKEFPEELGMQIPYILRYLDILKIKYSAIPGFEADDLIASVAKKAYNEFDQIHIISGDRDLLQLVDPKITVFLTRRGLTDLDEYNNNNFYEKLNIYPNQILDYKGLVGDSSDNLPGIKGIGEKTAIKLLNEYQNLEEIYQNIDKLTGKVKESILANYETGLKCRELARLVNNVELDFSIDETSRKPVNIDELLEFYQELDFSTFMRRLEQAIKRDEQIDIEFSIIDDINYDFTNVLNTKTYVVLELDGKNYYSSKILGIGILNEKISAFLTEQVVLKNKSFISFLENDTIEKSTFDYKRLYVALKKHNINVSNVTFDLLLAGYLINPTFGSDDFKKVALNFPSVQRDVDFLGFEETIYGTEARPKERNVNIYSKYALQKAHIIKKLEHELIQNLKDDELWDLFTQCEMPLVKVLGDMELVGLNIDKNKLNDIGKDFQKQVDIITEEIYELAGERFNINSPQQLGQILFEKLGLPAGKKTKTGSYSTSVEILEPLAKEYLIAQKLLDYRMLTKLISTYINGLLDSIYEDGYVHPLYKQALTVTGRLSSVDPNIQNIPIRTQTGQTIRQAFVSRFPSGYILSADYSQIELRVLAELANEEDMIKSFNDGFDFHAKTASELFDCRSEDVTNEMRRTAKAINFGIIYGMSAWGLSESLDISALEANLYINKYFDKYRNVKRFLDEQVQNAQEKGYTTTILKRRRYIPELQSSNHTLKELGKRTAMNAPIQGSAADIIKLAMIKIHNEFKNKKLQSVLIAQVHDELVFDVKNDELEAVQEIVKDIMENVVNMKVNLKVEINYGKNWYEAK